MTWYAIRTSPGAQMPQREYAVEKTSDPDDAKKRGKGYRIVPSLNAKMSAVERALNDIGVQHYMPAEYKVVRNRKKTGIYELRRFAMLPGYVFVYGVMDWLTLRDAPGVADVVAIDGVPLQVSIVDIITLRTIEAKSQAKADREVAQVNSSAKADAVRASDKALKLAKRRISSGQRVKVMWGAQAGREATILGWDEQQQLKAIVDNLESAVSLPFDTVKLVA
jgi:transcription antitermination factor NusG